MIENYGEVGNRIQSKLNELGIKQVDAIKITGISKNAFSNYVSGNRIPDNKSLYKLSKFFNVSMEWLLIGVDVPIENLMLYKTMKNKEEVERILDLPVLGLIPKIDEKS
jgi:transcriptional regulator with XRE-family HTH domain